MSNTYKVHSKKAEKRKRRSRLQLANLVYHNPDPGQIVCLAEGTSEIFPTL